MKIFGFAVKPLVVCLILSTSAGIMAGDKASKRYRKRYVQPPSKDIVSHSSFLPCMGSGRSQLANYNSEIDVATMVWELNCVSNNGPQNICKFSANAQIYKWNKKMQNYIYVDTVCQNADVGCGTGTLFSSTVSNLGNLHGVGNYMIEWTLNIGYCPTPNVIDTWQQIFDVITVGT